MTIADLADKMQIHPQSLSRIISSGNTRPTTLKKMAEVLGVTVPELYGEVNDNVIRPIDEKEWCILKMIILNIPTQYGAQDVAYFMYKRPFDVGYKIKDNAEPVNLFEEYPRQKDYPHDEIDILIFRAVQEKYPLSRLQNKLVIFNADRDTVNVLMDPPAEEGKITLLPFVTPEMIKRNPAAVYYRYEIPINLYASFPCKSYQKYFSASFNPELQNTIENQHSTIIAL